jgi:uncharacterized protein involved in copper resistance
MYTISFCLLILFSLCDCSVLAGSNIQVLKLRESPDATHTHTHALAGFKSRHHIMSVSYFQERTTPSSQDVLSPATPSAGAASRGANALSSRITSVLSASYADLEIRDALETLDARGVRNTAETRRQIRLDVQKEVIQCNGEIVKDFGEVAEVSQSTYLK